MKKGICFFVSLLLLASLTACLPDNSGTENPASQLTDPVPSTVLQERLVARIKDLEQQVRDLKAERSVMRESLYQHETYYRTNWHYYDLLLSAVLCNHPVERFYAVIQDIERMEDPSGFIFTVDKIERNPDWDGPDPDTDFWLNPDESPERVTATQMVVANDKSYVSFAEKQKDLLNKGDGNLYIGGTFVFFTIEGNIVYFMQYGP